MIEKAFVEFYRDLLRQRTLIDNGFEREFLSMMPKLEEQVRESLEGPISVEELKKAIEELISGKTPGPDGLNAEIYKAFKGDAVRALYEVLSEAYIKNKLPSSFCRTHTVLIPNLRTR